MLNTTLGPSICSTRETLKPEANLNSTRLELQIGLQPAVEPFSSKPAKATYRINKRK